MHQQVISLDLPSKAISALKKAGYNHVNDVDLTDKNVSKILDVDTWNNAIQIPAIKTSLDVYEEECLLGNVLTFIKDLDKVLGGGIEMGQITEFCGESGSGKTQICFLLCVNVQLPIWCGGASGQAVYISTNYNFAKQRIREYAFKVVQKYNSLKYKYSKNKNIEVNSFTVEEILENIHYFKCTNYIELLAFVIYLQNWLESHEKIRLVVIDSISLPFKELDDRDKYQTLYKFLSDLQELSVKYKFAIVFTNDMTTKAGKTGESYKDASLGDSYYHRINTRILLNKEGSDEFSAEIIKSSKTSNECVSFKIH